MNESDINSIREIVQNMGITDFWGVAGGRSGVPLTVNLYWVSSSLSIHHDNPNVLKAILCSNAFKTIVEHLKKEQKTEK